MTTAKQTRAAHKNIKKAQAKWRGMSHRQHALAQPDGRARKRPGTGGGGKFYRVEVRPGQKFTSYRVQDVGKKGHLERLAGRRASGSWDTVSWLVSKKDARVKSGMLTIKDPKVRTMLKQIKGPMRHVKGDIFRAHAKNVPESAKPTLAMRRAQKRNIKKAQRARRR